MWPNFGDATENGRIRFYLDTGTDVERDVIVSYSKNFKPDFIAMKKCDNYKSLLWEVIGGVRYVSCEVDYVEYILGDIFQFSYADRDVVAMPVKVKY